MTFSNPITGGQGALVRPAIKSPNYVAGSAGWSINKNGSAEFNNVVIRGGTVISGTALYYNGTPAAGNLFVSISATAGTDSFGNAYVKGVGLYGSAGTLTAKDTAGNQAFISGSIPVNGLLAALPGMYMQPVSNTGDPASIGALNPGGGAPLGTIITSPSPSTGGVPGTDFSQIYLTGPYSGAKPAINLNADAVGGTINLNTVVVTSTATADDVSLINGSHINVGASGSGAVFASKSTNTTDDLLSGRITGDTSNSRFVVNHAGEILWGAGGASAVDVRLYRSSANNLKTDDTLNVNPTAGSGSQAIVFNEGYSIYADNTGSGTANNRLWVDAPDGGQVVIGPRTGANHLDDLRLRTDATTASAANMFIDSSTFKVSRSTSSMRYKQDVRDKTYDLNAVRQLRLVEFHDKSEMATDPDNARYYVGLIAEEVHALGLTEFVSYREGEPDAVMYDRICLALLQQLREAEDRITRLENHLGI